MIKLRPVHYWLFFFGAMGMVFILGALTSRYIYREAERLYTWKPRLKIADLEPRNDIWGENFPRQWQRYQETADGSFESKHGGSGQRDMLEERPAMVLLWAGYPFSRDYKQGRGHAWAIQDLYKTLRTGAPTGPDDGPLPSTCWTCKSPDVPRLMKEEGVAGFYSGKWSRLGPQVVNYIGCADCHDHETMDLRITRPALVEAFERRGMDISKATHQEMRSLVCAQCHVEYFFDKTRVEGADYLTFPWDKGLSAEAMEAYYDELDFFDWTHSLSRAPMLKAQHPDYELYTEGIHARRGVSCADCHMPYKVEGMQKFTDHKIQSPLNNVSASCQVCHREDTQRLVEDVYQRQDSITQSQKTLEDILVRAHLEAARAWELGADSLQMAPILKAIRHAQWRWDFAAASHGASFHAPTETARVINGGMAKAQDARVQLARLLARLGQTEEVPLPDISTKAKAQAFIGLDMKRLEEEKQVFLDTLVPAWLKEAQEREQGWGRKIN